MSSPEDIIKQAELISEETQKHLEAGLVLDLPRENICSLIRRLRTDPIIGIDEDSILDKRGRRKLYKKLRKSIKMEPHDTKTASVAINDRELNFFNVNLLAEIDFCRKKVQSQIEELQRVNPVGYSDKGELAKTIRGASLGITAAAMGDLWELNLAFIKAGGEPRPEFLRMQESL